ncbi:MAG: hypothetical protein K0R59_3448 [Sphingobacterium sp.]|jgi:hypothetical protein|nr:hypothetical protein [Sphingobacterium sp.]
MAQIYDSLLAKMGAKSANFSAEQDFLLPILPPPLKNRLKIIASSPLKSHFSGKQTLTVGILLLVKCIQLFIK